MAFFPFFSKPHFWCTFFVEVLDAATGISYDEYAWWMVLAFVVIVVVVVYLF